MTNLDTLRRNRNQAGERTIMELFGGDPQRQDGFSLEFDSLLFDYSKTNLDRNDLDGLLALAGKRNLPEKIEQMFRGEHVNATEDRPALHTALRSFSEGSVVVDGHDVARESLQSLARMENLSEQVRSGERSPGNGDRFTDIVNIGIGGSDLGPAMAAEALAPYADGPAVHFVSNVDGSQIDGVLRGLDPARTLVVVVSKTFRTIETLTNAHTARKWIEAAEGAAGVQERFIGVSSNLRETDGFGIDREKVFGFGEWVGGRYSVWGPVGLSLLMAIGTENFRSFLGGARSMDNHFRTAEFSRNMPVLLGLVGVWHNQVSGYGSRAILPYDQRLAKLPSYLQQLEMESNGKSVALDGSSLEEHSSPVIWGEPGTNGQHAFHQMLHQGTRIVPCEFMVAAAGHEPHLQHHHDILVANCLAQAQALMTGRSTGASQSAPAKTDGLEAHRSCPGNRPSTILAYPMLTPYVLGQVIALYEHRVFVEGAILGINSFDQWGVELGKELATDLLDSVAKETDAATSDSSTRMLLGFIHRARKGLVPVGDKITH